MNKRYVNRSFLLIVIKILKILHLHFVARILLFVIDKIVNKQMDATSRLYAIIPNPNNSCLCTNTIASDYDLQIIVPVYNVEAYIKDCIDSILKQKTHYRYVVTIVNDDSPDSSREILRQYENDPRIIIIDQKNRGLSGARNRALENIRGKYVMFVDSDDRLADHAIESLLNVAESSGADIVEGGSVFFRGNDTVKVMQYSYAQDLKELSGFAWGKIIRSELMQHVHFPEGYWFEDTIFFFLLFDMAKNMERIEDMVYFYRQNEEGITISSKGKKKALDTVYITGQLLKDRKQLGLPFSQDMYEKFLLQLHTNFYRTMFLKKVQLPVFLYSCQLKEEYFRDLHSQSAAQELLDEALTSKNYGKYLDAMI